MNLKEEILISIQTLELAGVHYRSDCEKVKSILLHLYGRRFLAPFLGLKEDAGVNEVMAKLHDYVYWEEWRD